MMKHPWLTLVTLCLTLDARAQNYVPVVTPHVGSLPFTMDHGVKVFHLIAEPVKRELRRVWW